MKAPDVRKQDAKWLELISAQSGQRSDFVPPSVSRRLERDGLIYLHTPHNPVHVDRYYITDAGRAALAAICQE
jgi:hypothetical protein